MLLLLLLLLVIVELFGIRTETIDTETQTDEDMGGLEEEGKVIH